MIMLLNGLHNGLSTSIGSLHRDSTEAACAKTINVRQGEKKFTEIVERPMALGRVSFHDNEVSFVKNLL
jgi:hypothetical protein